VGDPSRPLTSHQLQEKTTRLLTRGLGPNRAQSLRAAVDGLVEAPSLESLTNLLQKS
jgi:hypothetical protein